MNALPIIYGEKCYPTCNWENNQHKIYNALDRAYNALDDVDMDEEYERYDELVEYCSKVEILCSMFNNHIVGKMVYLPYNWYVFCKEVLARY